MRRDAPLVREWARPVESSFATTAYYRARMMTCTCPYAIVLVDFPEHLATCIYIDFQLQPPVTPLLLSLL